jgi:VanZ family protein
MTQSMELSPREGGAGRPVGRSNGRRAAGRWLAVAAWYGVITWLSAAPGTDTEATHDLLERLALGDLNGLARMGAHVLVFGILAVLVYRALDPWRGIGRKRRYALALALTGVLAVIDELHQQQVPLRHGRAVDVAIDVAGAALVLAVWLARERARAGRSGT